MRRISSSSTVASSRLAIIWRRSKPSTPWRKTFWAKILLVRYVDHPAGHAYCVWETDGTIYGYDRNAGGFPIPVYTHDAKSIAVILAEELSKHLHEKLMVSQAEFVEPSSKVRNY